MSERLNEEIIDERQTLDKRLTEVDLLLLSSDKISSSFNLILLPPHEEHPYHHSLVQHLLHLSHLSRASLLLSLPKIHDSGINKPK